MISKVESSKTGIGDGGKSSIKKKKRNSFQTFIGLIFFNSVISADYSYYSDYYYIAFPRFSC